MEQGGLQPEQGRPPVGVRRDAKPLGGDAVPGVAAMVPASPTPLTPSGLTGDGVSVWWISGAGTSVAYGIRKSMKLALSSWPVSS